MFGLGMGNFWNPESGFPCAGQGREIVWGTRPQKRLPGVPRLRAGFGLGHSSRPQQQDTALWPVCTLMPEGGKYYTAWPRGLLMTVKGALDHPGSS